MPQTLSTEPRSPSASVSVLQPSASGDHAPESPTDPGASYSSPSDTAQRCSIPSSAKSVAALAELAAALETGCTPDPAAARLFALAFTDWLEGRRKSLDAALGLGGEAGLEGGRRRYLEARRDQHLAAARNLISAPPWKRLEVLADEIKRFEQMVWPRWSALGEPPPSASALRRHLFTARSLNARALPQTAQGLAKRIGTQPRPHRELVETG